MRGARLRRLHLRRVDDGEAIYPPRMTDRDVERGCPPARFIETLRRVADALERGEGFRIQVGNARLSVPAGARLSIEHEREGDENELELQLSWTE